MNAISPTQTRSTPSGSERTGSPLSSVSRRAFVGTAASALVTASTFTLPSIAAAAPRGLKKQAVVNGSTAKSLTAVQTEAAASAGGRLLGSPWLAYFDGAADRWAAMWVSWLLRGNGVAKTASVTELYTAFATAGRLSATPLPGSVVFYLHNKANTPYHVGFVTSVTGRIPQTLEGDVPTPALTVPLETFVKRYTCPWDSRLVFANPVYN